jgi:hypothetical protein
MPRQKLIENKDAAARDAKHGEKMIEIKVRFWTDKLADSIGQVIPKHAWTSGVVRIARNEPHGITPGRPIPFNSLLDLSAIIEKCLLEHEIVLHPSKDATVLATKRTMPANHDQQVFTD